SISSLATSDHRITVITRSPDWRPFLVLRNPSLNVSVAAGFPANVESSFHFRDGRLVVFDQSCHTLWLRFHFQQRLLEIEIDGKLVGKLEGKPLIFGLERGLLAQNPKELFVELDGTSRLRLRHVPRLIIKEDDFTLKVGALLVQVDDLKPLLAFRVNVQSAVIVLF